YRDEQGFEVYRENRWLENYRAFLDALSKECEIITCKELLELIDEGKIRLSHTEDIAKAWRVLRRFGQK
ncbi:MAG: hypothetical protein K2H64_13055, partial [Desulfovibrio sp.]|nr:hypothetical protein [Desulfovibrio sp.]